MTPDDSHVLYIGGFFFCLFSVALHEQRRQSTWGMQQCFCPNMYMKGQCTYLTRLPQGPIGTQGCFLLIYWLTLQVTQLRDELPGGRENVLDGLSKGFQLNTNHSQSENNAALAPNKEKTKQD